MEANYTTIDQSKKLLDLGLNKKTADMFYCYGYNTYSKVWDYDDEPTVIGETTFDVGDVPCWSLGALVKAMPSYIVINESEYNNSGIFHWELTRGYDNYLVRYENQDGNWDLKITAGDTLIEAVINMVIWLLENEYIKSNER